MVAHPGWIAAHKIPVGAWVADGVDLLKTHFGTVFDRASGGLADIADSVTDALLFLPAPLMVLLFSGAVWWWRRSWRLLAFVLLALLFIVNQGYWPDTMATLTLIAFSTAACMVIGVPLGIACAHRPWLAHTRARCST